MTERFTIPYPNTPAGKSRWAKLYGLNRFYAGTHWSQRKEAADFWHMVTRSCMNNAGVRKKPFEKPVVVTFYWNSRLDIDNNSIIAKMIIDGMKGRLIQDDSRRYLMGLEQYFHDEDRILVIVRELKEDSAHGKAGR